jgi:hypothetical protein
LNRNACARTTIVSEHAARAFSLRLCDRQHGHLGADTQPDRGLQDHNVEQARSKSSFESAMSRCRRNLHVAIPNQECHNSCGIATGE